jgi:hypothetical protein
MIGESPVWSSIRRCRSSRPGAGIAFMVDAKLTGSRYPLREMPYSSSWADRSEADCDLMLLTLQVGTTM